MSADPPEPACAKLKRDLDSLAIPNNQEIPNHKRFFPQTLLRHLLMRNTIEDVLRCSCSSCTSRVEAALESDIVESSYKILSCTLLVFALLVHIKCPKLIFSFIRRGFHDDQLLDMAQDTSIGQQSYSIGIVIDSQYHLLETTHIWFMINPPFSPS